VFILTPFNLLYFRCLYCFSCESSIVALNYQIKTDIMKSLKLLFLIFLIFFSACNIKSKNTSSPEEKELKGTITISGAFALYPMTTAWAEEFRKKHPKVRIDISAGGAGKGMTDALSGIVDLGMFSRGITEQEKATGVWWIAVARDAVLPTINSECPHFDLIKKSGLTKDQFKKLYIGWQIKTWTELLNFEGQEIKNINIYTRADACGAAQMWG